MEIKTITADEFNQKGCSAVSEKEKEEKKKK